jgi:Na+/H+ antiporter NhaC
MVACHGPIEWGSANTEHEREDRMQHLKSGLLLSSALLAFAVISPTRAAAQEVTAGPKVVLGGVPFTLTISAESSGAGAAGDATFIITDASGRVLSSGEVPAGGSVVARKVVVDGAAALPLQVTVAGASVEFDAPYAPGWLSLSPPFIAIIMALVFKEVLTSLFAGLWLGALMIAGYNPISALWRTMDAYVVPALADGDHASIVVFSLMLGGMVGVVARNGGTQGIVDAVTPFARNPRRGKLATLAAGLAIFFDDYANTLIVGNTMRPITDRLKISREKLAYIVDSTAAPVAAVVPISTWVGYEITLIGDGLHAAAAQPGVDSALAAALSSASPFAVFLQTIPYLFYPLLAVGFVLLTSVMDRDFGPMAKAERRAAAGGGLFREGAQLPVDTSDHVMDPKEGATPKWYNAGIPVLVTVGVVLGGLYVSGSKSAGSGASLMDIFGAADPFATLLWGSLSGVITAIVMSVGQRILTMQEALDAWIGGMKVMLTAMVILTLAWSLGAVTQDLGTAAYLSQILSDSLALPLVPLFVFVVAAAMAFATGTSWTTMAILIPLVIPLTVSLGGGAGFELGQPSLLLGATASVLAGAIFGDHCSPISDTTVLSSTASACDHVDHVRTQLPYALVVAAVGMLLGNLGTAYGLPPWAALVGGLVVLAAILKFLGQPLEINDQPAEG